MAETERSFDPDSFWLPHPLDDDDPRQPLGRVTGLYIGAAGVIWALRALEHDGMAQPASDWREVAAGLPERYRAGPDFPDYLRSLMLGEAGILLVAHALAQSRSQEERLLEIVRANAANPALELFFGSPGTMLAAQVMYERTGAPEWVDAWNESADRLWAAWEGELWRQGLRKPAHVLGPAHGFAGNVFVLARGDLLRPERRAELERRAVKVIANHAVRADGRAQWPPSVEEAGIPEKIRTQWCHGAPGIVASLATLAPCDSQLTELLVAGGELTWRAGPLTKGAGLCHGTAGNGYAFLKLFERTGDELWLERARAFAMHAIEQVEGAKAEYGRGRHTLWTGDPGTALYLSSCIAASAVVPTLDAF